MGAKEVAMKAKLNALALVLVLCAALFQVGCGEPSQATLNLTHYYSPDCPHCNDAKAELAKLEKEFPGQVKVTSVDATSKEGTRMLRGLEYRQCGLVVRGRRGEALWKQGDHTGTLQDTRQALRELLETKQVSEL